MTSKNDYSAKSWVWRWFFNNKMVSVLLIILLITINILLLRKISFVFTPLLGFASTIAFPVITAGVIFYILNPLVRFLEKKGLKRLYSIWIALVVATLVIVLFFSYLIPLLKGQILDFVRTWPNYYNAFVEQINRLVDSDWLKALQPQLAQMNDKFSSDIASRLNSLLNMTVNSIGNIVGAVTEAIVGLITMPIILFYLLKDQDRILPSVVKVFPTKSRESISKVLREMHEQISRYISGQLTVAFCVAVMFIIGYMIIGLNYGTVIGIFAGVMNIIPYLGSFVGMIPAIVIALVTSPMMLVKVLVVFMIEQTLEGRIISPLVLGNNLSIHPVTILFILLAAGKMFGFLGLLLGIPGYAVAKVVVTEIFEWYKQYSGAYHPEGETADEGENA
ncbi:AI-2E family transporter [Atopobacter sp. AH10]|uniref:AI-2E family transporter n=1 Tax=Atopobacter sp. AH10 TaxID=2315861 RepID=UPI001F1B3841|nr:AI-2E family transporter [Atopobacter sp. AH10]